MLLQTQMHGERYWQYYATLQIKPMRWKWRWRNKCNWQGDASEIITYLGSLVVTDLEFNMINHNTLKSLRDDFNLLGQFIKEKSIKDFCKIIIW